ncbi:hypothetical protein [Paracidobacterium acidisoli]|nr:hypothetical protein [Paracidobacterium acidisoli]MBT9331577.1 hypothetical protein [Paracidobacterium acidisoli]
MAAAGCSSGSSVKAGPISVTSSTHTGQVSSLAVSTAVNVSTTPVNDPANEGVDWTVTCGGNPVTGSVTGGACGTLAPTHTPGGAAALYTAPGLIPLGTTVTITASVASNPSQTSRVRLTILPPPVAVALTTLPAVTSVQADGTIGFIAQVTNDPTNAGVQWALSCGSSDCGSFSATSATSTTYTAPATVPANGTVTITATSIADSTKSASTTITIVAPPPPGPIAVSVSPASQYVATIGLAKTAHFTATVANDSANQGVDWTLKCGNAACGSISPAHTASGTVSTFVGPTAIPTGGTVTITATSTADPGKSASAVVTIVTNAPIVVTLSNALPAVMPAGSQSSLTATVANDTQNLGVNWTATCGSAGACGTFSVSPAHTVSGGSILYTAPAAIPSGNVVTITAASPATTPANPAIGTTTIVTQPPSVAFSQSPPASLTGGAQAPVSATVTNDIPPGGVTWTVQCNSTVAGGCGAILPYQTASGATATYTAPPVTAAGTIVTIHATSNADSSVTISSASVAIHPSTTLSIGFIPAAPAEMQPDSTVNLNAAVSNDSTGAGVDWQVCASGCGFFTTRPAVPAIPATATTPYVPAVPAVTATSVPAWADGLPIPYTAPSQQPASGPVAIIAAAHADSTTAVSATIAITSGSDGPALHGRVFAGAQPVAGASVGLYAAGTSGYASASSELSAPGEPPAATTDKNGNFTIPAGYSCAQPNSQVYLVAIGGQVGTNDPNHALTMMTALGSCDALSSSSVIVNEVTTVASVWALAPFAANDALTGNTSYLYIGTSSTNVMGLANAFATVNNLIDIATGQALYTVPAGNATAPYVEINTMADILNACTATSGGAEGDGSPCGNLLSYVDPLSYNPALNPTSPTDTLQAAFNIAQHPDAGLGYEFDFNDLFTFATPAAPFQPILAAQPNDWSLSLNYTGGGGLSASSAVGSFAIDSSGDLWITDTKAGSVIEWNGQGAALSPSNGFEAGGGPLAIDAAGDVWISGDGSLTELTNLGTPSPGSPFTGVPGGGMDMAIDAQGNVWITSGDGVAKFNNFGVELSPGAGYTNPEITNVTSVAVDSSSNIWVSNQQAGTGVPIGLAELSNAGGQLIFEGSASSISPNTQLAADGSGDIWNAGNNEICKVSAYSGTTILLQSCYTASTNRSDSPNVLIDSPRGTAIDGAGNAWVAGTGGNSAQQAALGEIVSSIAGSSNAPDFVSPGVAAGSLQAAVDGSGSVWVLQANNTVTEYVGLGAPVVQPIALAEQKNKLGARP